MARKIGLYRGTIHKYHKFIRRFLKLHSSENIYPVFNHPDPGKLWL